MILRRASATVLVSIGVVAAVIQGCSPADTSGGGRGGTKNTGGSTTASGGSSTTGGAGGAGASTGTGGTIIPPVGPGDPDATVDVRIGQDAACAGEPVTGEKKQVDLLMMMDSSGSMTTIDPGQTASRWSNLATAIPAFVADPANAGMMIGLDFFPEGGNNPSCNVSDYSMLNVPIALIPGMNNSQATAIGSAIMGRMPAGGTPTVPALQGALQTAYAWQMMHPDRSLNVLFLTDGEPQGCASTVNGAAAIATMFSNGTPPIKTYVLGVGPNTGSLDQIAAAGGTRMAYMVTSGGAADLSKALADIRKSTLSCDYAIPKPRDGGAAIDFNKINVSVRVGTNGTYQDIFNVGNAAGCTDMTKNPKGEGWYFDIPLPGTPTKITLCGNSCGPLQVNDGSSINVLLGCVTKPIPPPM